MLWSGPAKLHEPAPGSPSSSAGGLRYQHRRLCLLFAGGRLNWLAAHSRSDDCVALASRPTLAEITRVVSYRKFRLEENERLELLGEYSPDCQIVGSVAPCPISCRDAKDQMFLDLAYTAHADALVTGDEDLLVLAAEAKFRIESPESHRKSSFGSR